jgi:hypothetical protein
MNRRDLMIGAGTFVAASAAPAKAVAQHHEWDRLGAFWEHLQGLTPDRWPELTQTWGPFPLLFSGEVPPLKRHVDVLIRGLSRPHYDSAMEYGLHPSHYALIEIDGEPFGRAKASAIYSRWVG